MSRSLRRSSPPRSPRSSLPARSPAASPTTPAGRRVAGAIDVDVDGDECNVSADAGAVGHAARSRSRTRGDDVTEFYLLGEDGLRVVGEVENVGPGLTRDLVVQAQPGTYFTACKPGMVGDGIRAAFTVTDSGASIGPDGRRRRRSSPPPRPSYVAYVKDQVGRADRRHPGVRRRLHRGRRRRRARACTRRPASTGSASSPSPSRSATSTPCSTCARPTSRRATPGPAGT